MVNIVFMFRFLETDTSEQKKYEKRIQISVGNTVNDLRHEIKFTNRVKDKNDFFLLSKALLFLETYFFKIPKNLIALAFIYLFILPRQILKNVDMPWQKP